jgi:DNA polymerase-3 subunit gamma/tau
MEQNYDSILDRLNAIEAQLEKGVSMVAPQPVQQEVKKPEKPRERVKACSEDVQMVLQGWNQIVRDCSPLIKSYLLGHKDFRQDGNGGLQIVLREALAADLLSEEDLKNELETAIFHRIGKEVSIQYISVETDKTATANLLDVDYLQSIIHADIQVEEE